VGEAPHGAELYRSVQRLHTGRREAKEEEDAFAEGGPREGAQVPGHLHHHRRQVGHAISRVVVRAPEVEDAPHDALRRLEREESRVHRQHQQVHPFGSGR